MSQQGGVVKNVDDLRHWFSNIRLGATNEYEEEGDAIKVDESDDFSYYNGAQPNDDGGDNGRFGENRHFEEPSESEFDLSKAPQLDDETIDAYEEQNKELYAQWEEKPWRTHVSENIENQDLYLSVRDFHYDVRPFDGPRLNAIGSTKEGNSVTCRIVNHNHGFLVQVPRHWDYVQYVTFYEALAKKTYNAMRYAMGRPFMKKAPDYQALFDECFEGSVEGWPKVDYTRIFYGFTLEQWKAAKEYKDRRDDIPRTYMRIATKYPSVVPKAADKVNTCLGGVSRGGYDIEDWLPPECDISPTDLDDIPEAFESKLKYPEYVCNRIRLKPETWIKAPVGSFRVVRNGEYDEDDDRVGNTQTEIEIDAKQLVTQITETEKAAMPVLKPLVTVSFDIETEIGPYNPVTGKHKFPTPEQQQVLIIGQDISYKDNRKPPEKVAFILGNVEKSLHDEKNTRVFEFDPTLDGEIRMLLAWRRFILHVDPDTFISYNGQNFDFYYLLTRARALGISKRFSAFTRVKTQESVSYESIFKTRGSGSNERKLTTITGAANLDILRILRKEKPLRSYTLNAVAYEYLKKLKDDIDIELMPEYMSTIGGRTTLVRYCFRDCELVSDLEKYHGKEDEYSAMAELAGVRIQDLADRGMQYRIWILLIFKFHDNGYAMPDKFGGVKISYVGAFVKNPRQGWYIYIIIVFDFSSLYPSLQQENNICYITVLSWEVIHRENMVRGEYIDFERNCVKPEYCEQPEDLDANGKFSYLKYVERIKRIEEDQGIDYYVVPDFDEGGEGRDYWFKFKPGATASPFFSFRRRVGIIPLSQIDLFDMRNQYKGYMKKYPEGSPQRKVYNGKQLGCKLTMNSIYGVTSADMIPDSRLAFAVTHAGQVIIRYVRYRVQQFVCKANGFSVDLECVAGDTDSIMNFLDGVTDTTEAEKIGFLVQKEAKKWVRPPHILAFEKMFIRAIMSDKKKRYAVVVRMAGESLIELKIVGFESVRLDNFTLLPKMQERAFHVILIENDLERAIQEMRDIIRDMREGEHPFNELIFSKKFTKSMDEYANPDSLIHVSLVKTITARDPAAAPRIGDRLKYVIKKSTYKGENLSLRGEDPIYAFDNDTEMDMDYYIEFLEDAMTRVLQICGVSKEKCAEIFHGEHTRARINQKIMTNDELKTVVKELDIRRTSAFQAKKRKAKINIPIGDGKTAPLIKRAKNEGSYKQMPLFVKKFPRCVHCKAPLTAEKELLCAVCVDDEEIVKRTQEKHKTKFMNKAYTPLNEQMAACSECRHVKRPYKWAEKISCTESDCDGYWIRRLGQKIMVKTAKLEQRDCGKRKILDELSKHFDL